MAELPSGTITFLFTDIEGSTRLWELYPDSMRPALVRHDALISETVHRQGGTVVRSRGEGDSLFAVFARATDAVAAAGEAQRQIQAEGWPTPIPLRVRMALHTGEADLREGDYYGSAVNRCARLRAAAHGGQVLLSGTTRVLVQDHLPEGVSLQDLGEHRLKDLVRPERIYQLRHPELPADFPPLKTLDARPNNLPIQPTPLLGREGELETARGLLRQEGVRLLTLTGPGGTGKTRLGLQVAADLVDEFEDGVFFIALASIEDPDRVGSAIAQALGVRETGEQSLLDNLKRSLREKQMLLLLDNFEQVLSAGSLVSELLASCPRLKVLVTSRAALRLRGEREFPVAPLALPPRVESGKLRVERPTKADSSGLPTLNTPLSTLNLTQYAAVALFIQRARAVKPDFAVTNENAPAVAEICHRLDGLPLAIELAAARVKLLSPQRMLSRLGTAKRQGLDLLTGGSRDLPPRQQTLRAAIAWSYDLLPEEEKSLFRRLAIFVGGCTLEDAEAVCGAIGCQPSAVGKDQPDPTDSSQQAADGLPLDVLEGVGSLVDKSLLRQEEREAGDARLTMLETIREYALERLEESDELDTLRERHAHHFLGLAEAAVPRLQSADQVEWLERLEVERDNLRAALAWSVTSGNREVALRLAGALWPFWYVRGHWTEGREWLASLLASGAPPVGVEASGPCRTPQSALPRMGSEDTVRARALDGAGVLAHTQGDYPAAQAYLEESLAIRRELHRQGARDAGEGLADTLNLRALLALDEKEYEAVQKLLEDALSVLSDQDHGRCGKVLHNLALVASRRGSAREAQQLYEAALQHRRSAGDIRGEAETRANLGVLAHNAGDLSAARSSYLDSLTLRRALGDRHGIGMMLNNLAELAEASADVERAVLLFRHAERIFRELESTHAAVPAEALQRLSAPLEAERWRELLAQADVMTWEEVVQRWQE